MLSLQEPREHKHESENETHVQPAHRENMDDAELLTEVVEILVEIRHIAEKRGDDERLLAGIEIAGEDVGVERLDAIQPGGPAWWLLTENARRFAVEHCVDAALSEELFFVVATGIARRFRRGGSGAAKLPLKR